MRKAKIVSCLLLAASALLPLAGHAQDRGRGDERGGPPMGRGHGDRDRGWDRHHGDEGRGPVDIDRRADRDRPGRWAKGDRIPRNTASANISSTTGAPTTWPAAARLPLGRRRRRLFPGRPDRYRLQRDDRRLTRACRNKNPRSRLAIAGFLLPGRRSGRGRRTVQRVPHDPSARLERMQAQAQDARRNPRQVMAQLTGAPGLIAQLPDDVQRPGPAQESERLGDLARRRRRGSVLA